MNTSGDTVLPIPDRKAAMQGLHFKKRTRTEGEDGVTNKPPGPLRVYKRPKVHPQPRGTDASRKTYGEKNIKIGRVDSLEPAEKTLPAPARKNLKNDRDDDEWNSPAGHGAATNGRRQIKRKATTEIEEYSEDEETGTLIEHRARCPPKSARRGSPVTSVSSEEPRRVRDRKKHRRREIVRRHINF